jgi:hypothetical protein
LIETFQLACDFAAAVEFNGDFFVEISVGHG